MTRDNSEVYFTLSLRDSQQDRVHSGNLIISSFCTGFPPFPVSFLPLPINVSWNHVPNKLLIPNACSRMYFGESLGSDTSLLLTLQSLGLGSDTSLLLILPTVQRQPLSILVVLSSIYFLIIEKHVHIAIS